MELEKAGFVTLSLMSCGVASMSSKWNFSLTNIAKAPLSDPKLLVKLNIFYPINYKLNSIKSCFINNI